MRFDLHSFSPKTPVGLLPLGFAAMFWVSIFESYQSIDNFEAQVNQMVLIPCAVLRPRPEISRLARRCFLQARDRRSNES